ncbi:MAG TPA: YdaS family helix-turn-helix protein [Nevskiaceae bacterium]|nr:YdaS family helix-turn-helix protein [Nevskiaceae bacterium]
MAIAEYLREKNLTQAQFAELVGVTQSMVAQWVGGIRRISAERAIAIEEKTGRDLRKGQLRPDLWPDETAAASDSDRKAA